MSNIFQQAAISRTLPQGGKGGGSSTSNTNKQAQKAEADRLIALGRAASSKVSKAPPDLNPQAQNNTGYKPNAAELGKILSPGLTAAQLQALLVPGYNNQNPVPPSSDLNAQAQNAINNPDYLGANVKTPSVGSGSGGSKSKGGIGSGVTPAPIDLTFGIPDYQPTNFLNPYNQAYDDLIAGAKKIGGTDLSALDALRGQIGGNYDQASKGMYDQYQNYRQPLDQEAKNLGVNPQDIYKGYDENLRKIQENNDSAKAADQSWADKMRALRGSELDNLYVGLGNEKVVQMANWSIAQAQRDQASQQAVLDARTKIATALATATKSGGSGKGSKGGGSKSSSSGAVTDTATQTDTVYDPNFLASIANLSPEQQAQAWAIHEANSGNKDIATTRAMYNTAVAAANAPAPATPKQFYRPSTTPGGVTPSIANTLVSNPVWNSYTSKKNQAQVDAANAAALLAAAKQTGGIGGIPASKQVITSKGSKKYKP